MCLFCVCALFLGQQQAAAAARSFVLEQQQTELPQQGQSMAELREQAVAKLTESGFDKLLQRLTPRDTWWQHAQLLSSENAQGYLQKFTVDEEELDNGVYQLTATLFFDHQLMRDMLTRYRLPYSEAEGGRVLLLPVLETADKKRLWEEDNPWRAALLSQVSSTQSLEFIIPDVDLQNMRLLTPDMAVFGAADALKSLAGRYSADAVVVLHARYIEGWDSDLTVSFQWVGERALRVAPLAEPGWGQELNQIMQMAAGRALGAVADAWRQTALVEVDNQNRIFVRYSPQDPTDLEQFRRALLEMEVVKSLQLRVMNVRSSLFEMDFFGEPDALKQRLQNAGWEVAPAGNLWRLSRRPQQAAAPAHWTQR